MLKQCETKCNMKRQTHNPTIKLDRVLTLWSFASKGSVDVVQASHQDASRVPLEVLRCTLNCEEALGQTRTFCKDYISHLAWEHLGIPQGELESVAKERDVWNTLLRLPPPPDLR